ncbi:MAG: hypothetical protein KAW47_05100, partial [Thermoplasmatales archaeon]|nr:hypothetical protein [Thermoplasmatales archaeon]
MLSNALDDECTGRSPCRGCKWHLQGLDKNQCVDKCERLAAYRNGEPWEGLDVPMHEHGGKEPDFAMLRRSGKEIVEMEEIEEKEINIEHVSRHSIAKP